jgi:hypothetical protein
MTTKHWFFLLLVVPVVCFLGFLAGIVINAEHSKSLSVKGKSYVSPVEFLCAGTTCAAIAGASSILFLVLWVKNPRPPAEDEK